MNARQILENARASTVLGPNAFRSLLSILLSLEKDKYKVIGQFLKWRIEYRSFIKSELPLNALFCRNREAQFIQILINNNTDNRAPKYQYPNIQTCKLIALIDSDTLKAYEDRDDILVQTIIGTYEIARKTQAILEKENTVDDVKRLIISVFDMTNGWTEAQARFKLFAIILAMKHEKPYEDIELTAKALAELSLKCTSLWHTKMCRDENTSAIAEILYSKKIIQVNSMEVPTTIPQFIHTFITHIVLAGELVPRMGNYLKNIPVIDGRCIWCSRFPVRTLKQTDFECIEQFFIFAFNSVLNIQIQKYIERQTYWQLTKAAELLAKIATAQHTKSWKPIT